MLVCHDLKLSTEPVAPPLPSSLRVVPILFYVAIAGCAFFAAYFMIQKGAAERSRVAQERVTAEEKRKIAQIQMRHQELESDLNKAKSMIEWVKGSEMMQPLAMKINDSVDVNFANINRLALTRDSEIPWQIKLDLQLNTMENGILERTIGVLDPDFRKIAPRRVQQETGVSYSVTLMKQNNSRVAQQ